MMGKMLELLMPSSRPPESDEMRAGMPKPAALEDPYVQMDIEEGPNRLVSGPRHLGQWRPGSTIRDAEPEDAEGESDDS